MARRSTRRGWPGREPGYSLDITGRIADAYLRVSSNPDEQAQHSIDDQRGVYAGWVTRAGVEPGQQNADDDRSASRYRSREREGFAQVRAEIAAGKRDGHVLWFWSSSRQTRGDIPLDVLAAESEAHGIVWCTDGQVLNPANGDDMATAGMHNIMDKQFSDRLSKDVLRGKKSAALAGRPAAVPLYGYRRVVELNRHGQPVMIKGRPVIDHDEPCELDAASQPVPGTPAAVVLEIFDRIEHGDTLAAIRASLEDRRIPAPRRPRKCTTCGETMRQADGYGCPAGHTQDLCQWHASAVRFIAMNEGYLSRRIFQPESDSFRDRHAAIVRDADGNPVPAWWPPLVSERQFWAVQRILSDEGRVRWRGPGRGNPDPAASREQSARKYLMVPAARCGSCGAALGGHFEQGRDWYKCRSRGCTTIRADWLEDYAEQRLVSWLVLPEVRTGIYARREDEDAAMDAARADLEQAQSELAELIKLAAAGKAGSPALAAATETGLLARITDAEQAIRPSAPPVLLDMLGPEAADRWWDLRTRNMPAARQLMAAVATLYVHPAAGRGGGASRGFDESRAEWHWNIGADASTAPTREGCTESLAARKAALDAARSRAADMLRADPAMADAAIGRKAGCAYGTVGRIRRKLMAAGEITDPGYRTGKDGKEYRVTGNGKTGAPRKSR